MDVSDKVFFKSPPKVLKDAGASLSVQEKNEARIRKKLLAKLSALLEVQDKEEKKYRNAGRVLREEKAEARRRLLEKTKEGMERVFMTFAEEGTRRDYRGVEEWESGIKGILTSGEEYHRETNSFEVNTSLINAGKTEGSLVDHNEVNKLDTRSSHISYRSHGSLVPRLSMARLRSQDRPPRLLKELRKNPTPQVREQALQVVSAAMHTGGYPVISEFVALGFVEDVCNIMSEARGNRFLTVVCCEVAAVICQNLHPAKFEFTQRFAGDLRGALEDWQEDEEILKVALDAIAELCDECPNQRSVCDEVGMVDSVLRVGVKMSSSMKNCAVEVFSRCLQALEFLGVNHVGNKEKMLTGGVMDVVIGAIKIFSDETNIEPKDVCVNIVIGAMLLLRALISYNGGKEHNRVVIEEKNEKLEILLRQKASAEREIKYKEGEKALKSQAGKRKKDKEKEKQIVLDTRDRPKSGRTVAMIEKDLKKLNKKITGIMEAEREAKRVADEKHYAGLVHCRLARDFVDRGGVETFLRSVTYHIESPTVVMFYPQTLHALLSLHTRPFCVLHPCIEEAMYKKIIDLSLYVLNKYSSVPTIVWGVVLNLFCLCEREIKCAEYIDLWRLGDFKLDKKAGDYSEKDGAGGNEDISDGEDEGVGTESGVDDDDDGDDDDDDNDDDEDETADGTGCKILMVALLNNKANIAVQEQFMRLFINISKHFNCRMSLLRVDAFDEIDVIKQQFVGEKAKAYTSLVNRCQLALETGNVF